jgi:hypothetical protein
MRLLPLLGFILGIDLINGSIDQWCPPECSLEEYKPLCETKWLFIISTGRAGSTTILHALRGIKDLHLIGETNIFGELRVVYENSIFSSLQNRNLTILLEMQRLYQLISCPSQSCRQSQRILGGKEVHLTPSDISFLKDLFPCSRFILNIRRNSIAQSRSAFLKRQSATDIAKRNSYLVHLHESWFPESHKRTYLMVLEDFTVPLFDDLLRWIGLPNCYYHSIGHFNMNGSYDQSTRPRLSGSCRIISSLP